MRLRWALAGSVALLTVSMVSSAQIRAYPVSQLTMDFVRRAAEDGLGEVALARMARGRSTDPPVQRFAQHMLTDHGRANGELRRIAARRGWRIPSTMGSANQAKAVGCRRCAGRRSIAPTCGSCCGSTSARLSCSASTLHGAATRSRARGRSRSSEHSSTTGRWRTRRRTGRRPLQLQRPLRKRRDVLEEGGQAVHALLDRLRRHRPTESRNQPSSRARPNAWNGTTARPAPWSSSLRMSSLVRSSRRRRSSCR